MKLYIFRHGDILNPRNILYLQSPSKEYKLSDLGKQQIEIQAARLKAKLSTESLALDAIYYSPLYRTTQTAQIIQKILKIDQLIPEPRLMDAKSPAQDMPFSEFDQKYNSNLYHPDLIAQGGETIEQIKRRMMQVLDYIYQKQPSQPAIVVSHGDPIRILQLVAEGKELTKANLGSDRILSQTHKYPAKGSITILEYQNQKLTQTDYWPPEIGDPLH